MQIGSSLFMSVFVYRENRWYERKTMREGVSSAAVCECNEKIYVIGGGPSVKVSSEKVQVMTRYHR